MDGVLVVFDTESVFNISSATDLQCITVDRNASHSVEMYLESKSHFIHYYCLFASYWEMVHLML